MIFVEYLLLFLVPRNTIHLEFVICYNLCVMLFQNSQNWFNYVLKPLSISFFSF